MAYLFGAKKNDVKPDYTSLQLQTSTSTLPIPIVWGQTKLAPNVLFYDNFQPVAQTSGGKGGLFSTKQTTGYYYTADIIMALCEGPISNVGSIWVDQSVYALTDLQLTLFNGTTPQAVWSYLTTQYPSEALAYQGTAYACAPSYYLGDSASVSNHNFEVFGALAGTGVNGIDADPAQVIYDFLTNAQYGAGFSAASINGATLFGSGGDASLQTYCRALGIAFSPALATAEQGSSILNRWLQICNTAAVWSGGQLKFIPYGDVAVAGGATGRSFTMSIPNPPTLANGGLAPPAILVAAPGNFVSDGGVVNAITGAALAYIGATNPSAAGQYGISPAGTYLFNNADKGTPVTISATTNTSGGAYAPNLTPAYTLTDLDFVDDKGNKDPVQASRVDPYSLPNIQRIECLSRSNQYAGVPVEARDQSQIEAYGPRVGSTVQAHEICDEINVAPVVAQTILQRGLYVRAHYTFKLSWEFCLLDPMDILAIPDPATGTGTLLVRITTVEEDDNGILTITAEELVPGVSTPGANPSGNATGSQPNRGAAAPSVNPPLIFEPPPALTNNVAQVWVGASGAVSASSWGGANVFASVDNSTYSQIGTITQPLRQGVLTASLASAIGWDTTHTLAVNLTESAATLTGTSAASAQTGATVSLVDSEVIAYQTATLTGANAYNLTGLERAFAGSLGAAHASGAPFARLDAAVVKYNLPSTWIGVPLYFKFQSFNATGGGLQSLAACAVYTYTPTGASSLGLVTQALQVGTSMDWGAVAGAVTETDNWGAVATGATTALDLGTVP